MFVSPNHHCHNQSWLFSRPGDRSNSSSQCLACLVDILEDVDVSKVQKEVTLGILESMIENMKAVSETLSSNGAMCSYICNLMYDRYTGEPFKKSSVPLCTSLLHLLQDEQMFQALKDRVNAIIHGDIRDIGLHFYMAVLRLLCERSLDNIKIFCLTGDSTITHILQNVDHLDGQIVLELSQILKYVVQVMLQSVPASDHGDNPLLGEVVMVLMAWLSAGVSRNLHSHLLVLLSECVKSPTLIINMLVCGEEGNSVLLMGLKRLLATKDDSTVVMGIQCLTSILECISQPIHIKIFLDTDLAEFIFEFLHSSNVLQLNIIFQCLLTMAKHQLFFEKCHAVYGMETTLSAIRIALDTRKYTVMESGLKFLTCLLDKQPDNMPLFVNQSWQTCARLLNDSLQFGSQHFTPIVLSSVEAFLRPKHQQSLVDVRAITQLLKSTTAVCQNILGDASQESSYNENSLFTIRCLFSIANSIHGLMVSDELPCGNETVALDDLQLSMKSLCLKLILPWTVGNQAAFDNTNWVHQFLTFLEIAISMAENDEELIKIVPIQLIHQALILVSKPYVSHITKDFGLQVLMSVLKIYIGRVKPALNINTDAMIVGFSRFEWYQATSPDYFIEFISHREMRGPLIAFMYLSMLFGYTIFEGFSLLHFLKTIANECPYICSDEPYVVRGFIYMLAVCQANSTENVDQIVFDGNEVNYLTDLGRLPVDAWYTEGSGVFNWALLSRDKLSILGRHLVEYWIVHLDLSSYETFDQYLNCNDRDRAIITSMFTNVSFLQCLMDVLLSMHIGIKARDVLDYCIVQLSDNRMSEIAPTALVSLVESGAKMFDSLFIQSTDVDCTLASHLLHLLCRLLESPVGYWFNTQSTSCLKTVYNVVKLIHKCDDQGNLGMLAVQYLSGIVKGLSPQESKTVIPVVLQSRKCASLLESIMEDVTSKMFYPGLTVVVWLASHGENYEGDNFVTVRCPLLLQYLSSCNKTSSLLVLLLLKSALQAMVNRRTMFGACRYMKPSKAFVPLKIFSPVELKQIYGILQQYVCQDDVSLRREAASCIETLLCTLPEMDQFIIRHSWNTAMIDALLSRTQNGITDFELTLCYLLCGGNGHEWSVSTANNFLLALLYSDLLPQNLEKAYKLVKQIKTSQLGVDMDLMDTVVACLEDQ